MNRKVINNIKKCKNNAYNKIFIANGINIPNV